MHEVRYSAAFEKDFERLKIRAKKGNAIRFLTPVVRSRRQAGWRWDEIFAGPNKHLATLTKMTFKAFDTKWKLWASKASR